ncbi:hypothetical protein VP168E361_P0032 [Vibrio phage 168E36-1]|nr:hypothetical protein VP168E361_P0032 [Vibrio phage 168E36-1]
MSYFITPSLNKRGARQFSVANGKLSHPNLGYYFNLLSALSLELFSKTPGQWCNKGG